MWWSNRANFQRLCVRGSLLVLQAWHPFLAIKQVEFLSVDLWLQLHLIPMELFYFDMAGILGSAFGQLLDIDWSPIRQQRRDFFRVLVRIKLMTLLFRASFLDLSTLTHIGYEPVTRRYGIELLESRPHLIEAEDGPDLVFGIDRGSSVESDDDLVVASNGFVV
ncbi:hypothetical protein RJ640_015078 [Escallonia rubra]|uniref:DUF4283 domain-containing protein n=1 Tax=Escallonia rubra TaxID=112253 RepID=A0AA88R737_9ASTE|nr:hypothetical protein RJ640_015078 [Escallonia rubra]